MTDYRRLLLAAIAANVVGAVVVFLLLLVLLPGYGDPDDLERLVDRNVAAFVLYLAVTIPVGVASRRRRFATLAAWMAEERSPTEEERRLALHSPLDGVGISALAWGGAAVLFTLLNLEASVSGALVTGVGILLGGATTCALLYLLHERLLRPFIARALQDGPPPEPVAPGVQARLTMAWGLGTGVPALGVVAVTAAELGGANLDERLVVVVALLLGVLALAVGFAITVFAARSLAEPVAGLRGALERIERGEYDARVTVDDGSEVGLLQSGFNRMAAGLAERERIREAFGTYVDRDVAEHILREGTSLAGEEVEVTLMFVDVRGFTGFAEHASAREVVATINRLFELVVPIVHAHAGHVDKFVGDGLLAVFGAPRRREDHADQALAAALEIAQAVRDEFGEELSVGVGLNSGVVVAGNVGGAGRLEFSVIGDAVNVAARVEAATRQTGDTVLLAQRTKELLRAAPPLVERPGVRLKGKSGPATLYAAA
ncbi:MAG TPA: adenylate/guanylate cyclase domain-containing protein [Solirubrobacteraceae bacterium]|nr:adenylate/guanylate cyclase domain-containing protein [Solirubrobacteraceae bacterium]